MNEYFAKLTPLERRFVVVVAVVVFVVLNLVFVKPHFGDWGKTKFRLAKAHETLDKFQGEVSKKTTYEAQVKSLESEGSSVPPEDQAIDLLRTIQSQATMNGVIFIGNGRLTTRTNNPFFLERTQPVNVSATESNLVNFLYILGEGNSMIRVRDLSLRPDPPRQQLTANIQFTASYQKKSAARSTTNAPAASASTSKPATSKNKRP